VVDDDQSSQLLLGTSREECRQPNQCSVRLVLVTEAVEAIHVLDRTVPFWVERQADNHLPVVLGSQRLVGLQGTNVGEQNIA